MRIAPRKLLECFPRTLAGDTIAIAWRHADSRRRCEAWAFQLKGRRLPWAVRYGLDGRGRANFLTDYLVTEVAAHGSEGVMFSAAHLRANRLSSAAVGRLNLCLIFSQCVSTVLRLR